MSKVEQWGWKPNKRVCLCFQDPHTQYVCTLCTVNDVPGKDPLERPGREGGLQGSERSVQGIFYLERHLRPLKNPLRSEAFQGFYPWDCQRCPRERTIYKGSELLGDMWGRAVYRSLRGLFKASFIWKDTSDLCKPSSGVFPRSLSLGHH